MGGPCSTYCGEEKCVNAFFWADLKEIGKRDYIYVIKMNLLKIEWEAWTGLTGSE
jgi:hypothetical protein